MPLMSNRMHLWNRGFRFIWTFSRLSGWIGPSVRRTKRTLHLPKSPVIWRISLRSTAIPPNLKDETDFPSPIRPTLRTRKFSCRPRRSPAFLHKCRFRKRHFFFHLSPGSQIKSQMGSLNFSSTLNPFKRKEELHSPEAGTVMLRPSLSLRQKTFVGLHFLTPNKRDELWKHCF